MGTRQCQIPRDRTQCRRGEGDTARVRDYDLRISAELKAQNKPTIEEQREAETERRKQIQEVAYARCVVAAYEAQASNVAQHTVSCMRIAGYRLRDDNGRAVAMFEAHCAPAALQEGTCQ